MDITVETTLSDKTVPSWLLEGVSNERDDVLIIYPNEATRSSSIQIILERSGSVDSSRHTTLSRLIKSLSMDFRLPVVVPKSVTGLVQVHDKFADAASKHRFPRLHPDVTRPWTSSKTERLLLLHSYAIEHQILSRWEGDPGALEANRILTSFEGEGLIHEHHILTHLCEALSNTEVNMPYTVGTVTGIILLNHPPDFSEIHKKFIKALSHRRPVHHLCVSGSFRLGYHGAYIDDEITPIRDKSELPSWVPEHEILLQEPHDDDYATKGVHVIRFEQASQIMDATVSAIQLYKSKFEGDVLLIDADKHRHEEWARRLQQIGVTCDVDSHTAEKTSAVQAILRYLAISRGQDAWSAVKLFDIIQSKAFPILENLFSDLEHPVNHEWRPRPHLDVLENIGRSFHVLGGTGALQRWLGSLASAKPYSMEAFRRENESRALEETQWWLQCLATAWSALLDENEKSFVAQEFIGTTSKVNLPLPKASKTPRDVLTTILEACSWENLFDRTQQYDGSVGAVQTWVRLIDTLVLYDSSIEFVELCRLASTQTKLPSKRTKHADVIISTPEQAYGIEAGITMLAGLNAESWSMKPKRIPWIDDSVRVELGLSDGDLPIRRSRHLFKSIINTSQQSILFDTEYDESAGNSTPVVEYLSMVELKGELRKIAATPSFIEEELSDGTGWSIMTRDDGNWLTYRTSTLTLSGDEVLLERAEDLQRDRQQQAGLELRAMRPATSQIQSPHALASRHERDINLDRFRRQRKFKPLENNATMDWELRDNLLTTSGLVIDPTTSQAELFGSRVATSYPHLGFKKNGRSRSPSIDPRPLPPPNFPSESMNAILSTQSREDDSKIWSTSRLNPWFICPRKAWMEQTLRATEPSPEPSEDIAPLTKGTLIHSIEEHIMTLLGIEVGGNPLAQPVPLHIGTVLSDQEMWESILRTLSEIAPWLARTNAVSVHRCNDLIGCSPEQWNGWLEGNEHLPIGGRLGRLLFADLCLTSAAPIACEWPLQQQEKYHVDIEGLNDEMEFSTLNVRGRIDRVDSLVIDESLLESLNELGLYSDDAEEMPLFFDGNGPPAKRFILIRDLKTIEGPKPDEEGVRHASGLFKEIQLALYARAWERSHPGDRVIGVGISEVGDDTNHLLELDPAFAFLSPEVSIGSRTFYSGNHFRIPGEGSDPQSNGFRAWMSSRITAAIRASEASKLGWNHPTPGSHCGYCSLASACPSASIGGEIK